MQIEQGLGRWSEELRHKRQTQGGSKRYEVVVVGGGVSATTEGSPGGSIRGFSSTLMKLLWNQLQAELCWLRFSSLPRPPEQAVLEEGWRATAEADSCL